MAVRIINADVFEGLAQLPDESVHCVVTSPPYHQLRSYLDAHHPNKRYEIGQEPTFAEHLAVMVCVFREVRRVLRSDGVCFVNYGDGYAGGGRGGGAEGSKQRTNRGSLLSRQKPTDSFKEKDLKMMPARLAIALCDDGWWLRSEIIWAKKNPMPESVEDRPTSSHEKIYLLAKSERYFYDAEAVKEKSITNDLRRPYGSNGSWQLDGRPAEQRPNGRLRNIAVGKDRKDLRGVTDNRHRSAINGGQSLQVDPDGTRSMRNVWHLPTEPSPIEHYAIMPTTIAERCIKAGTSEKGCCSKCGAPWARLIETRFSPIRRDWTDRPENRAETKGWRSSCKCEADVAPCTILDPFGGVGTTGIVADRLGRNAILIELSEKHARAAENRISGDAPLFAEVAIG